VSSLFVCLWTAAQLNPSSSVPGSLRATIFYFDCEVGQTRVFQNVASHLFWRFAVLERPKAVDNVLREADNGGNCSSGMDTVRTL